jgi:hypothetical protein
MAAGEVVTFDVLLRSEQSQETVALSIPKTSAIGEVVSIASKHFETEFTAISLSGVKLDVNDSFVDYFEPDETFVLHIGPKLAPGTLLAENAQAVESLQVMLQVAELLLAKGAGEWPFDEFKAKVVGKAPLLVIVEFAGGVCGGFAAVSFPDKAEEFVADPTGASFVFSLQPTARYPLKDSLEALILDSTPCFAFGNGCLGIFSDGDMGREERSYAVPSGWETDGYVKFTRFEVWRVTP